MFRNKWGYSLVELVVSVAILGLLATLAVGAYQSMSEKAKYGRAKADMAGIRAAIMGLRASEDQLFMDITGSFCTACSQGRNSSPVCTNPNGANAVWKMLGYNSPPFDPWGNCYLIDENEGEFGQADCRFDAIISGGTDRTWQGSGDGDDVFGDDAIMRVPYLNPRPGCNFNPEGQLGGA